ncbi:MAG: MinD/ParA family protein [Haloarculaceae archaeon]
MTVVAVAGRSGVGATTVAYNLAAAMGAVVVDADLDLADLPADRGPDLHDVLAGRADPVESVRDGGPVPILPCGRPLDGSRPVDPGQLSAVLARVASAYGGAVLDAGAPRTATLPVSAAETCVPVATPTPRALAVAVALLVRARGRGTGLASAVCNRAGTVGAAAVRALGWPVTAVPASDAVVRAARHGLPVAALDPDGPAAGAFDALAAAVQRSVRS